MDTMTAAEEAIEIKDRIYDALEALEQAGHYNAAALKASDPIRYTDEKLQSIHESSVKLRNMVYDREVSNSRHNDKLRIYERFLTDPTVTAPQNIRAVYEAVKTMTTGAVSDAVTREHLENASQFEFVYFLLSNEEWEAAFGAEDRLETGRFTSVLRSVYITGDEDTRAFLDENLTMVGRTCREENLRETEEIRSHVTRLALAKKSGIALALVDGTL